MLRELRRKIIGPSLGYNKNMQTIQHPFIWKKTKKKTGIVGDDRVTPQHNRKHTNYKVYFTSQKPAYEYTEDN